MDSMCTEPTTARPMTTGHIGVVNADLGLSYQGIAASFAGAFTTPRVREGNVSGITTWSPPD